MRDLSSLEKYSIILSEQRIVSCVKEMYKIFGPAGVVKVAGLVKEGSYICKASERDSRLTERREGGGLLEKKRVARRDSPSIILRSQWMVMVRGTARARDQILRRSSVGSEGKRWNCVRGGGVAIAAVRGTIARRAWQVNVQSCIAELEVERSWIVKDVVALMLLTGPTSDVVK